MKHPAIKKKQKSTIPSSPQTPDEYLALGVEHEESGEKWRAGDAAKAVRFFKRAMDVYGEGMKRFPKDFDLAFNMAHVQYEITQHSRLLAEFDADTVAILEQALASHRTAMSLNALENPDIVFNTAQVLASLAEALDNDELDSTSSGVPAEQLLAEATHLLQTCFTRQQHLIAQREEQTAQFAAADGGVSLSGADTSSSTQTAPADSEEVEEWAAIEEPVSSTSLAETATALLEVLTTSIEAVTSNDAEAVSTAAKLHAIQHTAETVLGASLPALMADTDIDKDTKEDLFTAKAKFGLALQVYTFGVNGNAQQYSRTLDEAFELKKDSGFEKSAKFLAVYAEALIDFATAVADAPGLATLRWTRLTKALDSLAEASKILDTSSKGAFTLPDPSEQTQSLQTRGDVEMMRFSTCRLPDLPANLRTGQVRLTLIQNAQKVYIAAEQVASKNLQSDNALDSLMAVKVRSAVAMCIEKGQNDSLVALQALVPESTIRNELEEMLERSLVTNEILSECGIS